MREKVKMPLKIVGPHIKCFTPNKNLPATKKKLASHCLVPKIKQHLRMLHIYGLFFFNVDLIYNVKKEKIIITNLDIAFDLNSHKRVHTKDDHKNRSAFRMLLRNTNVVQ